ncbi:MAG TPA: chromate efflux transporter [Chthoniobacterales bacterium]|nr:chromate efflux transporter [Chthoniobacterales bacterium]
MNEVSDAQDRHRPPSFAEAFRFWLKLGFVSFGGPSGQIAMMHAEVVEKKRWIDNARFLHALNFCMLLPGPEAQQLAIYIGWLLHKTRGGIVAGALFVIPSIFILWALSYVYVAFGNIPWIAAIFYGLKPAVLAIVAAAVIRIGSKALKNAVMWSLALAAFVAIYFFHVPFPLIIISAGILGLIGSKILPEYFRGEVAHPLDVDLASNLAGRAKPTWFYAFRISVTWIVIWALPLALAGIFLGTQHTIFREGIFFSKAAVVTFGGAYAVLPYVSQQAVEHYHWLAAPQMLDGLGLAETTPGPLIMVLQFVGFLGAWNHPGNLPPLVSATLGALVTTWTTFVPCFLWVFLGAPYIEKLREVKLLTAALSTVTAAVVGVILNLAVWFGLHVIVPASGNIDWFALILCALAFVAMLRYKIDIIPVVLGSGVLGLIYKSWL